MSREKPGEWPLEPEEFVAWAASVRWHDTVSKPQNPHQYCLKFRCPSPRTFELMVLHLREHGHQEWFGGREYTYLEVWAGRWKYWTMMDPLECTVLINRKKLPGKDPGPKRREDQTVATQKTLPELYTSRYMAQDVLSSGVVVPMRISMIAPERFFPLGYEIAGEARSLMPERPMQGEWRSFSPAFWRKLDRIGPEKIADELTAISAEHDGRALALLCFEDLQKGQRCHRAIVSAWIESETGIAVPELTDAGEVLALEKLHPQVMPVRPR